MNEQTPCPSPVSLHVQTLSSYRVQLSLGFLQPSLMTSQENIIRFSLPSIPHPPNACS